MLTRLAQNALQGSTACTDEIGDLLATAVRGPARVPYSDGFNRVSVVLDAFRRASRDLEAFFRDQNASEVIGARRREFFQR